GNGGCKSAAGENQRRFGTIESVERKVAFVRLFLPGRRGQICFLDDGLFAVYPRRALQRKAGTPANGGKNSRADALENRRARSRRDLERGRRSGAYGFASTGFRLYR